MKYYEIDFKIKAPKELMQDCCDVMAAMTAEAGLETFEETGYGIKGYAQQTLFDKATLDMILEEFPFEDVKIEYTIREAEDKDWNEVWENEGFDPIIIGNKCTIHDGRHLPLQESDISIEIDAKLAFGTGTHETTRMVVNEMLDIELDGKTVLDCGCGTGILGIVALKKGAAMAIGYDIDEWSTDNSMHNAIINRVEERYKAVLGNSAVIDDMEHDFDLVVANINRNILICDMAQFCKRMKPGAILILSGFYETDTELIKDKAKEHKLEFEHMTTENEWACMRFKLFG